MIDAKKQLVDLLVERAFKPALLAAPFNYDRHEREVLARVQGVIREEITHYRNLGSAEEVVDRFRHDHRSGALRQLEKDLRYLELPTLSETRSEFERSVADLGVLATA